MIKLCRLGLWISVLFCSVSVWSLDHSCSKVFQERSPIQTMAISEKEIAAWKDLESAKINLDDLRSQFANKVITGIDYILFRQAVRRANDAAAVILNLHGIKFKIVDEFEFGEQRIQILSARPGSRLETLLQKARTDWDVRIFYYPELESSNPGAYYAKQNAIKISDSILKTPESLWPEHLVHEIRHHLFRRQRIQGIPSPYHTTLLAEGENASIGSRLGGYSKFLSAEEIVTYTKDMGHKSTQDSFMYFDRVSDDPFRLSLRNQFRDTFKTYTKQYLDWLNHPSVKAMIQNQIQLRATKASIYFEDYKKGNESFGKTLKFLIIKDPFVIDRVWIQAEFSQNFNSFRGDKKVSMRIELVELSDDVTLEHAIKAVDSHLKSLLEVTGS